MERGRDLGISFEGTTGKWNGIIDVPGVCVGNFTKCNHEENIYTGVTAILPHGKNVKRCFCAISSFNGNGEATGMAWVDESGLLETPILLSNTHCVGIVRDSVLKWMDKTQGDSDSPKAWVLPVVLETFDGDMNKHHFFVQPEHVFEALDKATNDGPIPLGSIGGGTGNIAYDFKAGCGSSSRITPQGYHVGVWCQVNIGLRHEFILKGVPIGKKLTEGTIRYQGAGSLVVIIATDAPLMPTQLKRLANRCALAMGRTGTISHNGSGDIFLAFSTANSDGLVSAQRDCFDKPRTYEFLPTGPCLNPLFKAVIQATEEAVIDSILCQDENAPYTTPYGQKVQVLPHNFVRTQVKKYSDLEQDLDGI